ncbi:MAG: hypothetical protein GY906_31490 [bacterium]|nr:hypothetical protein [bacterium]
MEIYIASVAGLLSSLLLLVVYLADRYEREPIELIQNYYLFGLVGQLVLILAVTAAVGDVIWSGPWILITVFCAAFYLPFQLRRQAEMDERFDGIVYSVALMGGASCAIHLNNLPHVIAASPYHDALASGAEPDLRDLLILATSRGFAAELGQGLVVVFVAVLVGAALGVLQLRGWSLGRTAAVCVSVALAVAGLDVLTGGALTLRWLVAGCAIAVALTVKGRSVFRHQPETPERDVLLMGVKTVLMIFGAVLLATVLLQVIVEQPYAPDEDLPGQSSTQSAEPQEAR